MNGGDSSLKGGSKTALKNLSIAQSEKKVFIKKELTHHVIVKNEKLLLQALSPPNENEFKTGFGIAILPTGHNSTKNAQQLSLSRDPTQAEL